MTTPDEHPDTTAQYPERASFMGLPTELRLRIYEFALRADNDIQVRDPPVKGDPFKIYPQNGVPNIPILRVSTQARNEALPVYFQENTFSVRYRHCDDAHWFVREGTATAFANIRSLHFTRFCTGLEPFYKFEHPSEGVLSEVVRKCTNLKVLSITFHTLSFSLLGGSGLYYQGTWSVEQVITDFAKRRHLSDILLSTLKARPLKKLEINLFSCPRCFYRWDASDPQEVLRKARTMWRAVLTWFREELRAQSTIVCGEEKEEF